MKPHFQLIATLALDTTFPTVVRGAFFFHCYSSGRGQERGEKKSDGEKQRGLPVRLPG